MALAALLEKYAGVRLAKEYQKADWSRRPLSDAMLDYAADDTRHLPGLRDRSMRARLTELGRLDWATEEFRRLEGLRWSAPGDGPDAYLRLKGVRTLKDRQLAALRLLYQWRERLAAEQDRATFRIVGNDVLWPSNGCRVSPARRPPWRRRPASPRRSPPRYQTPLLDAVQAAPALPDAALPHLERPKSLPRDLRVRTRASDQLKGVRNLAATTLGLDPGVLCSRGILEAGGGAPCLPRSDCARRHSGFPAVAGERARRAAPRRTRLEAHQGARTFGSIRSGVQ